MKHITQALACLLEEAASGVVPLRSEGSSEMRIFALLFSSVMVISLSATCHGTPPNVLLMMADNLGHGDLACYGCPDIKTPNIDRLASQGVRFTNYYANGPECSPTRTALFTGRYQQRVGGLECAIGSGNVGRYDDAIWLADQSQLGLPPRESTLIHALHDAGYSTAGLGKWHLGYEQHFLPSHHGFDYFLAALGGTIDYFYHNEPDGTPVLYENDRPIRRDVCLITRPVHRFSIPTECRIVRWSPTLGTLTSGKRVRAKRYEPSSNDWIRGWARFWKR
ncbi:MAG: sulfatase-like hydrolase/transferase [Planctomycetia bacterium]|nr:sulfatase-like hydrolase/transferase [Planctomycetia bacterium]